MGVRNLLVLALAAGAALGTLQLGLAASEVKKKPVPPPPDYFPMKKDYWWQFENADGKNVPGFRITVEDEQKQPDESIIFDVHTQVSNGKGNFGFHEWYAKPKGWVLVNRAKDDGNGGAVTYETPRKVIENPLKVDETWNWSGTKFLNQACTENNKVESEESVETPAGKFNTMKVVTNVVQGGQPVTKTYWYAPWVGLVKSRTESGQFSSVSQLVDYSFRKHDSDRK